MDMLFETLFYIGFCSVMLGASLIIFFWNRGIKIDLLDFTMLAVGVVVLAVGIGGSYAANNTQKETILADAKQVFGKEVKLVQTKSPFSDINIESDGVRYRTYKENGKIIYVENSKLVDEENYGDRVIQKSE